MLRAPSVTSGVHAGGQMSPLSNTVSPAGTHSSALSCTGAQGQPCWRPSPGHSQTSTGTCGLQDADNG